MYFDIDNMELSTNNVKINTVNLTYQKIPSSLYEGAKNELTNLHLLNLAAEAETIATPCIYGRFLNDEHYLKTLSLVLNSTHETRNRIIFFLKAILPKLKEKQSFLDIGPGDGLVTLPISQHFKQVTVIDNNQKILNNLITLFPTKTTYKKISGSIVDAQLPSNSYDLATLSHILYYVSPSEWLNIVDVTYKSLTPDGLLVIVLSGDALDKADLIRNFKGTIPPTDQLATLCISKFGHNNVELYSSEEAFLSHSRQAMLCISAFMLADAQVTASEEALTDHVEQKMKRSENYFEMSTLQKYIVIRKQ